MQRSGVTDPAQVLAAGDTELDLAAGMNAGAKYVVAVSTGAQSVEHLATFPHTHVCDVRNLPELLGVRSSPPSDPTRTFDLAVVGAGVIGLAHAALAQRTQAQCRRSSAHEITRGRIHPQLRPRRDHDAGG